MRGRAQVRGSVLATVLMLTMLLAILTSVVAGNILQNYRSTNHVNDVGQSRYLGYAGLQHAMIKLKAASNFDGLFTGTLPGQPQLRYEVLVKNSVAHPYPGVPPACASIEAQVYQVDGGQVRSLSGMLGTAILQSQVFDKAASAKTMVDMANGSKTMAFNFNDYTGGRRESRDTASGSGYVDPASTDNGNVHADIACEGFLGLNSGAKVEGNIRAPMVDPDSGTVIDPTTGLATAFATAITSINTLLGGSVVGTPLTGAPTSAVMTGSYSMPTATPGAATTYNSGFDRSDATQDAYPNDHLDPGAYKSATINSGRTVRLRGGRYYFADSFNIQGEVIAENPNDEIVIYVGKSMEVSGRVNFHGNPGNFQVYFTDEDSANGTLLYDADGNPITTGTTTNFSKLLMNTGSQATMVTAGNKLLARLNGARLLGSISGQYVGMNDSTVEYDTRLKGRQVVGGSSWKLKAVYEQGKR